MLEEPRKVICPSSDLASSDRHFRLPKLDEIDFASRMQLKEIKQFSGGSYGYNLGIQDRETGVYSAPQYLGRSTFALMMDAPSQHLEDRQTKNHGGTGQNILYEDGHIRFVVGNPQVVCVGDNPLKSVKSVVEAGINLNDAVIGDSTASPLVKTSYVPSVQR